MVLCCDPILLRLGLGAKTCEGRTSFNEKCSGLVFLQMDPSNWELIFLNIPILIDQLMQSQLETIEPTHHHPYYEWLPCRALGVNGIVNSQLSVTCA